MNAAETIQAAIDKLGETVALTNLAQAVDDPNTLIVDGGQWVGEMMTPRMAADVVTLYRTIDAQLVTLRQGLPYAKSDCLFDDAFELQLARAILGEES